MTRRLALALLLCASLGAQVSPSININCGGPAWGNWLAGAQFCNGQASGDPTNTTSVWANWFFGVSFFCDVPAPAQFYFVRVDAQETVATVQPGGRVFTIDANGQQTAPIDLVKSGGLTQQSFGLWTYSGSGNLHIQFQASVRYALCQDIQIFPWAEGWNYSAIKETFPLPPNPPQQPTIRVPLQFSPVGFSAIDVLFASSQAGQSMAFTVQAPASTAPPPATPSIDLPLPTYRPFTSQDVFTILYRAAIPR